MNDAFVQQYVPQWQEKLGRKLFKKHHIDMPDLPGMKDCLVSRTVAHLSFVDRLKVLISGKIEVTTNTATEHVIGKTFTNSGVSVRPPGWLERK